MKKVFLTAAIFLTLAAAPAAGAPENASADSASQVVVAVENVQQTIVVEEAPAADETQGVQESSVAKRMTQAEKAHNAAVNDSWGGAITIIAMCIVIGALVVLSLLFLAFGKVSEALLTKNKRQAAKNKNIAHDEKHEIDSGEVIAAISMALTEHFSGGHDYEDTILTIRRMKRAYSPWNSKIYNIRHEPTVSKNGFGI